MAGSTAAADDIATILRMWRHKTCLRPCVSFAGTFLSNRLAFGEFPLTFIILLQRKHGSFPTRRKNDWPPVPDEAKSAGSARFSLWSWQLGRRNENERTRTTEEEIRRATGLTELECIDSISHTHTIQNCAFSRQRFCIAESSETERHCHWMIDHWIDCVTYFWWSA